MLRAGQIGVGLRRPSSVVSLELTSWDLTSKLGWGVVTIRARALSFRIWRLDPLVSPLSPEITMPAARRV